MVSKGTPKTLLESLRNGIDEANSLCAEQVIPSPTAVVLEAHVRDYLAQKFSTALITEGYEIERLYFDIIGGSYDIGKLRKIGEKQ